MKILIRLVVNMPPSMFTTVHYRPVVQRRITDSLRELRYALPPKSSLFAVFEQTGGTSDMGRQPHLHIVVIGMEEPPYRRLIHRLFSPFSSDIQSHSLKAWRTADIVLRYLQGRKKDMTDGERRTTTAWRQSIGSPAFIETNGARRRAARGVSPIELQKILRGY